MPHKHHASRRSAARNTVRAALGGLLSVWILAGFFLWYIGHSARSEAIAAATQSSRMLAAYASQTLKAGAIVVNSMATLIDESRIASDAEFRAFLANQYVHQTLRERIANMQEIDKAAFISAEGRVLNFSLAYPPPPISVADRDYFIEQMGAHAPDISLSVVATDRGSGRPTFYLARRLTAPDGSRLGLAIAGIDARFVGAFFARSDMGDDTAMYLSRNDGVLLTGHGVREAAYGSRLDVPARPGSASFIDAAPELPLSFAARSYVIATQPVAGTAAFVTVIIGDAEIFAQWRHWAAIILGLSALLSLGIVVTLRRTLRLIGELAASRDAAQSANTAKSQFLANMSHELRTPLNGILGTLWLARERPVDDETRLFIDTATRSADHLLAIVNDILDLSKLEAGRCEVEQAAFNLPALLRDVAAIIGPACARQGNRLACSFPADLPALVEGDAGRIRQVLLNLLSNAVKFTENGLVRFSVEIAPAGEATAQLNFRVSDTGIGIPTEMQAQIFQNFMQADASIQRRFGGSGLGLAISRRLARLMRGDISFKSEPGLGSTFEFTVPVGCGGEDRAMRAGGVQAPATATAAPAPQGAPALRVLIAEDVPTNQLVLQRFLALEGHDCVIVADGAEAVEAARSQHFDVVLMDVQMPHMDGMEATRRIRALANRNRDVPIIMVTAHAMAGDRETYIAEGASDYLPKPVRRDRLRAVLAQFAAA